MTPSMLFLSYSTCDDTASTVTTSLLSPTCIRSSTAVVPPTATSASRIVVRKPFTVTRSSYCPARSDGALYVPSEAVVTVRAAPVALLVMMTSAPGTTAPVSSITVPEMEPVGVCPTILKAASNKSTTAKRQRRKVLFIDPSLDFENAWGIPGQTARKLAHIAERRRLGGCPSSRRIRSPFVELKIGREDGRIDY